MKLGSEIFKIPNFSSSSSLDNNLSYQLIIVIRKNELNEMSKILLNNIIKAIRLPHSELIAILKTNNTSPLKYSQIVAQLKPTKLIIFGCSPHEIGMHIQVSKNRITDFNGHQLLFTSSLLQMMEEQNTGKKQAKIQLWNAIKLLFEL